MSSPTQVGKHDKMGLNVVPLKQLTPEELKVITLDLLKNMDPNDAQNEKSRGQIVLELMYKPFTDEEMPKETEDSNAVVVHEAQDLERKHHTNPQVRLLFRGEERRTKPVKKNRDPRWEEDFQFTLDEPPTNDRIHVEVVSTSSRMGLLHPKIGNKFLKE